MYYVLNEELEHFFPFSQDFVYKSECRVVIIFLADWKEKDAGQSES